MFYIGEVLFAHLLLVAIDFVLCRANGLVSGIDFLLGVAHLAFVLVNVGVELFDVFLASLDFALILGDFSLFLGYLLLVGGDALLNLCHGSGGFGLVFLSLLKVLLAMK